MSIIKSLFRPPESKTPLKVVKRVDQSALKKTQTHKRTNFTTLYPDSALITMMIDHNPKQANSQAWTRFEGYTGASTVGQALKNGVTYSDIANDLGRRFILVTDA